MTDCHHRTCCGCELPAEFIAEVIGSDGVDEFYLCDPHYGLLMNEAARKGVNVVGVAPVIEEAVRARCKWCAVFVCNDTEPTRWRSQDADHVWHDHEALLCPRCRQATRVATSWWLPLD